MVPHIDPESKGNLEVMYSLDNDVDAPPLVNCPSVDSLYRARYSDVTELTQHKTVPALHLLMGVFSCPTYGSDLVTMGYACFDYATAHMTCGSIHLLRQLSSATRVGQWSLSSRHGTSTYHPYFLTWRVIFARWIYSIRKTEPWVVRHSR